MHRRVLSCDQIRQVDRHAIEEWQIPGLVLMENAGRGVADVLCRLGISRTVVIACAKGNNGGDGFVIARHLHLRGYEVQLFLSCAPSELSGDAAFNFRLLQRTTVPVHWGDVQADFQQATKSAGWIVDALLGTGAVGAPREPLATWITTMNASGAGKLAVDIPSGLDARTGQPSDTTFAADLTCTFVAEKEGFANAVALPYLGRIEVLDIGLPWELVVAAVSQTGGRGTR